MESEIKKISKDSSVFKEGGLAYAMANTTDSSKPMLMSFDEARFMPCSYAIKCPIISETKDYVEYDITVPNGE